MMAKAAHTFSIAVATEAEDQEVSALKVKSRNSKKNPSGELVRLISRWTRSKIAQAERRFSEGGGRHQHYKQKVILLKDGKVEILITSVTSRTITLLAWLASNKLIPQYLYQYLRMV